jgi:predicted enzyme related to lactoylglutathione lyase
MKIRNLIAAIAAVYGFVSIAYAADAKPSSGSAAMPAPIVFFDIAGPDATKLHAFYASVFGWSIDAQNAIKTPGGLDGTLRQDPAEKIIYMGVPDINAALEQIKAAGGTVDMPRTVIPKVVTFALFKDPAGNRMGLVEMPKS